MWQDLLLETLISKGTVGIKQRDITTRFRTWATADELVSYLETLWQEGKVQRFTITTKGRPMTIWRATEGLTQ